MSTSKINLGFVAALLLSGSAASQLFVPITMAAEPVDKLVAVLKSDAGRKAKADACRELAVTGGKESLAVLAKLLEDEQLTHMARYALEPIADPAVDTLLREAAGKLSGTSLVGVIGSIGVRRDAKATDLLAGKLQDADADVAQAAARALGKIATSTAVQALQKALPTVSDASRLAFCEGLFRCAETLLAQNKRAEALAIYDQLSKLTAPHQVRTGAVRGSLLARSQLQDVLAQLRKYLESDDYLVFAAAVRASQELPGVRITRLLTNSMNQATADRQILVIQNLGKRGDIVALPALFAAAQAGPKPVRLAAVRSVGELGDASAVPKLIDWLADPDQEIAQAAQESLAGLPNQAADKAVLDMFSSQDAGRKLKALDLMSRRRMVSAMPILLEAAKTGSGQVRSSALKKAGELGTAANLPDFLELLLKASQPADVSAIEQALTEVCLRADKPEGCAAKLIAQLGQASAGQKGALLNVLGAIGGKDALQAVQTAIGSDNAEIHAAAIRVLSNWKTADAAPVLLELVQKPKNANDRTLCLRGYLDLVSLPELPADQRLGMCQKVAGLIESKDEKKLFLGALGGVVDPGVFALILPHLSSADTQAEAGMACVAVAEKLADSQPAKVIEPLKKVIESAPDSNAAKRAKTLLQKAQAKADAK